MVTPLPPVVHRKINKLIESARNVNVQYPGFDEFEVFDNKEERKHVLVLGNQVCDCGMWQLSGIPCVHVISCLLHRNVSNFEEHVDQKLRIPMYLQTYADMIHPVPDKTSWPEVSDEKIWPPTKQPKPGKPPSQEGETQLKSQKRTFVRTMTAPSSAAQFAASSMPSSTQMSILSQASSSRGQPSH
ncbi:hypothetical protein Pint_20760 [Pistacia integerrima]|uniref:Uncharacterized protein n=1 Tax=Pistacia integerrima TaxID=434235 RepID=A0ACC0XGV3_9ROSI|nr:hypothetical protein Pint_20760 [Pistacia integerrima]